MDLEPLPNAVAQVHELHPALNNIGSRCQEQGFNVPQQRPGNVVLSIDHAHHLTGTERQRSVELECLGLS
jgi:hypothetical protein